MAKMATMINGQLILEEEYDENYQPTERGKLQRRIKFTLKSFFYFFLFLIII